MFNFVLDHLNRNISVCFINSEEFVLDHFYVKLNLPVLLQGSYISDAFFPRYAKLLPTSPINVKIFSVTTSAK